MASGEMTGRGGPTVVRCRDRQLIERFLTEDYYDFPVCIFSQRLIRATSAWLARSNWNYFLVAYDGGNPAGFIFASTLGKRLWSRFALAHPWLIPSLAWTFVRMRWGRRRRAPARFSHALPLADAANKIAALQIPQTGQQFAWSAPDSRTGYVELLYVSSDFRGKDIAPALLRALAAEMGASGVARIEAHIDPHNYSSVRAFQKAHWTVVKTLSDDFLTYVTADRMLT